MTRPTRDEVARAAQRAVADLDERQLAALRRLTPERRLQLMFELCDFVHHAIIAYEYQRAPGMSDEDLRARYRRHIRTAHATEKPA